MTRAMSTTEKKTRSIIKALEEIELEVLRMESSSSHPDVRQTCRDVAALIRKYIGAL